MPMRQMFSNPAGRFVDQTLRGVGQVMLQNNPITGFLFLVGIFISDWVSALYAILGTVTATGTALLFGAPRDEVSLGLYGLNGTLTGLGLAVYLQHDMLLLAYTIVASMFVAIVTAAIKDVFGSRCYALTGPFVITTWLFIGGLFTYGRLHAMPALGAPHLTTDVGPSAAAFGFADAVTGILNGPAQVMLQQGVWTGAIFLVALAINSPISCAAAVLGSAIGVGIGWALGAAPSAIREGLYGFNAVLTAIALGGLLFLLHRITVLLAVLAVCVSTVLYGSLVAVLGPAGLPALTAPFVVTTWLCLLARGALPRLRAFSPVEPVTPEGNRMAAQQAASKKGKGEMPCTKR
jgi:urea transporter